MLRGERATGRKLHSRAALTLFLDHFSLSFQVLLLIANILITQKMTELRLEILENS